MLIAAVIGAVAAWLSMRSGDHRVTPGVHVDRPATPAATGSAAPVPAN
jgi:hypothetical protein